MLPTLTLIDEMGLTLFISPNESAVFTVRGHYVRDNPVSGWKGSQFRQHGGPKYMIESSYSINLSNASVGIDVSDGTEGMNDHLGS